MRYHPILRMLVALGILLTSALLPPHPSYAQTGPGPICGASIQFVSGAISTNTTWSSVFIYILQGDVTINTGVTLTIQPGTVIKAGLNESIFVHGTFNANGTLQNPIYFTSENDDTICGDTNGDGTTTIPAANDWGVIEFEDGSNNTSSLTRAVLRYGGYGNPYGNGAIFNSPYAPRKSGICYNLNYEKR
ncbi:hypothetical protein [Candidatus Oscillochloris fontis]|uniref:hypothetical protein n=1 Tax=Candidatus Oscillochloris fontis TaxID=2496868 RepID=UPI00101C9FC5|nr:hypothetical protein [Candidatus Oscillochloris fontis]